MLKRVFDSLECAYALHTGKVRSNNEDAVLVLPQYGFFAVSDGMGGASAGEVASRMVVENLEKAMLDLQEWIPAERESMVIRNAFKINNAISNYRDEHKFVSMGATLACLLFDPWDWHSATVFNAGDSRTYRFRDGLLEQLNEDHTLAGMNNLSEDEVLPPHRGILTNALGLEEDFFLERNTIEVRRNDVFLICSDGLTRMVSDTVLQDIFRTGKNIPCERLTERLLSEALNSGGRDNISIIVVRVERSWPRHTPTEAEWTREVLAQERNVNDLSDTVATA
ncbi:MAG: serine/threonine-protein phosphatase [Lentisphaerae bacterium]|jgi:serine/threonine protein phosphatase PrpC|nr:serine/threonine-protein phosphatase [Lentisphaerota bacterium]